MKKLAGIALALSPIVVSAAVQKTGDLIVAVGSLVKQSIVIVGGGALLVFLWGLANFIYKSGDEKSQKEGRNIMTWGLVAMFVLFSVWGIISFVQRGLGLPSSTANSGPCVGDCPQFVPPNAI